MTSNAAHACSMAQTAAYLVFVTGQQTEFREMTISPRINRLPACMVLGACSGLHVDSSHLTVAMRSISLLSSSPFWDEVRGVLVAFVCREIFSIVDVINELKCGD